MAQRWSCPKSEAGSCIYHLAKLPELNRGSPTPVNLAEIATDGEETFWGFVCLFAQQETLTPLSLSPFTQTVI